MSSVGQGSIEKLGGRLRGVKGSNRSSSSLAEKVSESSDKHKVREGTVVVMCAKGSWTNNPQRAGASDDQIPMCFTSKVEGCQAWLGGGQGQGGSRKRSAGIYGKELQRRVCVM